MFLRVLMLFSSLHSWFYLKKLSIDDISSRNFVNYLTVFKNSFSSAMFELSAGKNIKRNLELKWQYHLTTEAHLNV